MATTTYGTPYVSGTDLVANWPAASLTVANSIDAAGYYVGRGINAQTGSMTTVLTDAGKTITMSNASANTVTIPANSSVAYVIGTRINILNLGAGACTPTAGAGVTINGTITALATNSSAAVIKTATNTWSYVPFGSGGAATLTSGDVTSTTGSPTITTSGIYTIYQFTGSGTSVLGNEGLIDLLLTSPGAGGGGSATGISSSGGGGGGGGSVRSGKMFVDIGTYTITIPAGGAGGSGITIGTSSTGSTVLRATKISLSGIGAGGGGHGDNGPAGTVTGGNSGGIGGTGGSTGGAGGNGTGGNGAVQSAGSGGAGGTGLADSITGTSVNYAFGGGGGGGSGSGGASSSGGTGGASGSNGTNGTANRGGGGGGAGAKVTGVGGNGGSGIVIVRVVT